MSFLTDMMSTIWEGRSGGGGGYGGSQMTIDCNAALGLIGLIGLVELLRDIIEQITTTRKKRSLSGIFQYFGMEEELQSLGEDQERLIYDTLPGVLLPLLHGLVDVNDGLIQPECLERLMCEANRALMSHSTNNEDSFIKNVINNSLMSTVSSLLSDVLSKSFTNFETQKYLSAIKAGGFGRNGTQCEVVYPHCEVSTMHMPRSHLLIES